MNDSPANATTLGSSLGPLRLREEGVPDPARNPDQAEGEDEDTVRERQKRRGGEPEPQRRRQPDQAEGEDPEDEADRVPSEDRTG